VAAVKLYPVIARLLCPNRSGDKGVSDPGNVLLGHFAALLLLPVSPEHIGIRAEAVFSSAYDPSVMQLQKDGAVFLVDGFGDGT
jgi:hypothetical protein